MNVMLTQPMPSVFDVNSIYDQVEKAKTNTEKKDRLKLIPDETIKLPTTVRTTLMSTTDLCQYINEVFKPVAKDYYGSEVFPNANGQIEVNMVFKAIPDNDKNRRVFIPIGADESKKTENSVLNRINALNAMNMGSNTMKMTSYGTEILYDLMQTNARKKINPDKPETMNNFFAEIKENAGYGITVQNVYNTVVGLDIYKILPLIFGSTDDNGDKVIRKINPIRPLTAGVVVAARPNYLIEIQTMSIKAYKTAMAKVGMMPMPGAITAITGTMSHN